MSETGFILIICDSEELCEKINEQGRGGYRTNFFFLLSLQGLYVFAVYFVMHNQLCWPTKASYTVEMSGHDGPDSTYQGGGPTTVGGDISKSTQNLITAMEEVNTHMCTHSLTDKRDSLNSSSHHWVKNSF